jgi:hypothetical protein
MRPRLVFAAGHRCPSAQVVVNHAQEPVNVRGPIRFASGRVLFEHPKPVITIPWTLGTNPRFDRRGLGRVRVVRWLAATIVEEFR